MKGELVLKRWKRLKVQLWSVEAKKQLLDWLFSKSYQWLTYICQDFFLLTWAGCPSYFILCYPISALSGVNLMLSNVQILKNILLFVTKSSHSFLL